MYANHRIVCVTPAGRRRYLRLLAPHVLGSDLVDRYDLWVNTSVAADLAFVRGLERADPRVRLVSHPTGAAPSVEAIGAFSRLAMDPDTIYVRLDDDVVWAEPGFLEGLLEFRVAHPEYFLVMPLILNNALCSNILQTFGKITASRPIATACLDKVGWRDGEFALALHRFAQGVIRRGEVHRLRCGAVPIALNRFSINCLSWFGHDMAATGGVVGPDEEEELSAVMGARLRRVNCFHTDVAVAHFSFYPQREALEPSDVLAGYEAILASRRDLGDWPARVRAIRDEADAQDDGAEWGFPPKPPWSWRRFRRRLWPRKRRPGATLAAGPAF
jgi:hypothetical protein